MIAYGYCHCGCGLKTNLAKQSSKTKGWIKGEPIKFIKGHHARGINNPHYNGGLYVFRNRWFIVCRNGESVRYARVVVEANIKRPLLPDEVVHHINGNSTDDRIENLQLLTNSKHTKLHNKQPRKYSNEYLLYKLKEFTAINKRKPTMKDALKSKTLPYPHTYQQHFGSWSNALLEAGLN